MRISDIPALLKGVFSEAGSKSAIPQTTPDPGRASYSLGFPPKTMTTLEDGGIPPDGRDMNGILFEVSQAALWQQVMGVLPFEAAFATAKGYPSGAMVQHGGHVWRSTIDDNNATPTAASAGWELMSASGGATGQALMKASSKSGDFVWRAIGISDVFNLQSSLNGMQSSLNGKLAMGNSLPLGDGAASAGSSTSGSRQDHRHPTDTTRAPLESPALTGTPTAPTAAPGTNTKQIANTEFVLNEKPQAATAAEMQAGTQTAIRSMSPANVKQAVDANGMTPAQLRSELNATGSAPIYACRAWVNFNGTGTVAIRASGNVTSITDNGVGKYTVNFTTAMPDANYAVALSAGTLGGPVTDQQIAACHAATTTSASIWTQDGDGSSAQDASLVCAAFFR